MRYLYASLAAAMLAAAAVPAVAGTLLVPQKFPTIQAALNAAKPHDTVLVSAKPNGGVYAEAVTINTPHVTLQGSGNPIIDGTALTTVVTPFPTIPSFTENSSPNGIEINADHVAVSGLTVQNFGGASGYYVQTVSGIDDSHGFTDIQISGVTVRSNNVGLTIANSNAAPNQKIYALIGNVAAGNISDGMDVFGSPALISGNKFLSNGGNGLSVNGVGLTITGNESGKNAGDGIDVTNSAGIYDPAVTTPGTPNPAPVLTTLNFIHDNGSLGMSVYGTQTVLGNVLANNTGTGIFLEYADDITVSGNVITGTALGYYGGTGIYAQYSQEYSTAYPYGGGDSKVNISLNQISGCAGDGIAFYEITGGTVAFNSVTGNKGIGINLSDYSSDGGFYDYAPTTVTHNVALHNTIVDARDGSSAPDSYTDAAGEFYYGDGYATANIWTKNLFGTTDPAGLSK